VGLGVTSAVFLRIRFGVCEGIGGDSATELGFTLATGEVASVLFFAEFLEGEADSVGVPVSSCDWSCATETVRPIPNSSGRVLLTMTSSFVPGLL
jgi:hypothetical protein